MSKYMLLGMNEDYIYEGETEEESILNYVQSVGFPSIEDHSKFWKEQGINFKISVKKIDRT